MQRKDSPKILILCSLDKSLINFRWDLLKALLANGYRIFAAAPDFDQTTTDKLVQIGVTPIEYKLQRTGLNPLKDIGTIFQLRNIIKEYNIDLVFPYTIKPVIYGSFAANSRNVPVISLITGLGFTFSAASKKARMLRKVTELLYRASIRKNKIIIFQNSDDRQLFLDKNIITDKMETRIVGGSGVNLSQFEFRINKNDTDRTRFLFIARLIKEKGVQLFIDAAKYLKIKYPSAEFHIIGGPMDSPSSIKEEILNQYHTDGIIIYHGYQKNIQDHLAMGDIFVLPTYYREGVPRSILEALSVGLPIITTNTPGCKETVIPNENGFLIKPKNLEELINAMEYFLTQKEEIKRMGANSRKYAEEKFDVRIINQAQIKAIESIL